MMAAAVIGTMLSNVALFGTGATTAVVSALGAGTGSGVRGRSRRALSRSRFKTSVPRRSTFSNSSLIWASLRAFSSSRALIRSGSTLLLLSAVVVVGASAVTTAPAGGV
ncbi:hypothetical protein BKA57DRAFT_464748 [Linnemannia elongata]|nr:hypothetical protein BKA57DRAFT_464748 [Linnemannia elongata]